MRWLLRLLVPASVVLTLGCGGSDLLLPPSSPSSEVLHVESVRGNGQTASPMEEVAPPVIRVLNQAGEPIFDQLVTWVVTSGGGTVNPESSTTDRNGLASTKWRLGPAVGLNTVAAMVPGAETVTFTATAEVTSPTPSPSPDLS